MREQEGVGSLFADLPQELVEVLIGWLPAASLSAVWRTCAGLRGVVRERVGCALKRFMAAAPERALALAGASEARRVALERCAGEAAARAVALRGEAEAAAEALAGEGSTPAHTAVLRNAAVAARARADEYVGGDLASAESASAAAGVQAGLLARAAGEGAILVPRACAAFARKRAAGEGERPESIERWLEDGLVGFEWWLEAGLLGLSYRCVLREDAYVGMCEEARLWYRLLRVLMWGAAVQTARRPGGDEAVAVSLEAAGVVFYTAAKTVDPEEETVAPEAVPLQTSTRASPKIYANALGRLLGLVRHEEADEHRAALEAAAAEAVRRRGMTPLELAAAEAGEAEAEAEAGDAAAALPKDPLEAEVMTAEEALADAMEVLRLADEADMHHAVQRLVDCGRLDPQAEGALAFMKVFFRNVADVTEGRRNYDFDSSVRMLDRFITQSSGQIVNNAFLDALVTHLQTVRSRAPRSRALASPSPVPLPLALP